MSVELHARIIGKVQGVGFRYTAKKVAEDLSLVGTVKNLPDGSVELYAQGSREVLGTFIRKLKEESFPSHIQTIEAEFRETIRNFSSFEIIH